MADTTIKISEETRDRLRTVAAERGTTARDLAEQTLNALLTEAERAERAAHARAELEASGIAVNDELMAQAHTGSSFARLAALKRGASAA
ncbi:hypothetical protein [Streptomyces sp. MNP-20]|uniref:hypothetical protein n=1 Tax=Streptomyces sp. MNP-20 TaxID=2721165 RepID=UPI0015538D40|nr:hypothetical protein [Streptomyces sp. MNP-20]